MIIHETILKRYEGNPIFSPRDISFGAVDQVFNPGQVLTPEGKTILLLSVVMRNEMYARVHVAESTDGINFQVDENPLFSVNESKPYGDLDYHPIDCRLTRFDEDDCYYVMRPGNSDWGVVPRLYRMVDFKSAEFMGIVGLPHNRVPCLFPEKINGRYVRLDRPYSPGAPYEKSYANIWISYSDNLLDWGGHKPLLKRCFMPWNNLKIGPTVPVKTSAGWLEIIHGVQNTFASWRYSLGAVLLDLKDPSKIIGRMNDYLLTPEAEYERNGVIPEVVFATGCIADESKNLLKIYYGGADTTVNLATGKLDEIIQRCLDNC